MLTFGSKMLDRVYATKTLPTYSSQIEYPTNTTFKFQPR
jgi:hypothetical protein